VFGGGGYCSGGSGVEVGLDNSESGVSYKLYRNGNVLVATMAGTGTAISFGNQTVAGSYTVVAVKSPCNVVMNGSAVVTVNALPSAISITPASATICQGTIQSLSASGNPPTISTGSVTLSSGAISLAIPNNNSTGVSSLLKVIGIPTGATITSVSIQFNISHNYDGDLLVNLKGPNGSVLNIANGIGSSGNNFTNTIVASNGNSNIALSTSPYNATTYLPQAASGVIGAQVVTSNVSNVTTFSGLYGSAATSANGSWTFSARDIADHGVSNTGTLNNWSITINYTYISNPISVTWSPATDLYTDAGATTAYVANTVASTVYAKPSVYGSATYTATNTNSSGCTTTANSVLTINQSPQITMMADYCSVPGKIRVTATSDIPVTVSTWQWNSTLTAASTSTTSYIDPNTAATYYATANSAANSCPATSSISIAQELVTNGDFAAGNTGFTSDYTYVSTPYNGANTSGLWPEKTYTVDVDPQVYHPVFWGTDHTTADGTGNFMMVNGYGSVPVIWSETVTVLPNTNYYFSAYAVSLNNVTPFANLQFRVNGVAVGTSTGALPSKSSDNNSGTWYRFYSNPTWSSGTATTAKIEIVDLEPALGGNDFGLDDISFGTLSTFLNLTSAAATKTQTVCYNASITNITYEVGGDGSQPAVTGLPAGLTTYWNGRDLRIQGTPAETFTGPQKIFNYVVHGTGCNTKTAGGSITILAPASVGTIAASSNTSACYGSGGSVMVTDSAGNLSWESSTDGINYTSTGNTTKTQNFTNIQAPVYYRVTAADANGCSSPNVSAVVQVTIPNYWTGTNSQNWNTLTNWSDNQGFSGACPTVIIPAGTPNSPQLQNATSVQNINIASGAHLELNNKILTISGGYSGTGTLTGNSASGLVITGDAGTIHFTPNIYPGAVTNNYLKNLTINGNSASATIGDSLNIAAGNSINGYGTVAVTGGTLNANGNLILKSDVNGTARVDYSTGSITGNVTVERYIPPRRAWRFLSVPFSSSTQTIRDAWQEGATPNPNPWPENNPKPGFGTEITYGSGKTSLGFDENYSYSEPSAKYWDPNTSVWIPLPSTNISMNSYDAYCLFVRGSRAINLSENTGAIPDPTVLRIKGVLNQTGSTAAKIYAGGAGNVIFVGNPYASSINILDLITNRASGFKADKFWVWDPKMTGNNNVGGYVSYSDGVMVPPSSPSYLNKDSALLVESGQAFMVQLNNASTSATMNFKELDKVATENNVFGFAKQKPAAAAFPVIYTNLMLPTANGLILADGVGAGFDNKFSAAVDDHDSKKLWNFDEKLTLVRNDATLGIEFRPMPVLTDTLFYRLYLRQQPYVLQIFTQNIAGMQLTRAWLVDKYLNTETEVNLHDTTLYNFTPNSDLNSYRDRFMLVFKRQFTGTPVPVTKVVNESDPNTTGNTNSFAATAGNVNVYPNPASTDKVTLQFGNMEKGNYEVTVYSPKGQKLSIRKIEYSGGTNVYTLPLNPSWAAGVYTINIANEDSKKAVNLKLVISR
jgi:subtilisin-like proprotein convertase family protein